MYPSPSSGATLAAAPTLLYWICSDPDADVLHYSLEIARDSDILVGASAGEKLVLALDSPQWSPPIPFLSGPTYYWQVTAVDSCGARTTGSVWSFSVADPFLPITLDASGTIARHAPFSDSDADPCTWFGPAAASADNHSGAMACSAGIFGAGASYATATQVLILDVKKRGRVSGSYSLVGAAGKLSIGSVADKIYTDWDVSLADVDAEGQWTGMGHHIAQGEVTIEPPLDWGDALDLLFGTSGAVLDVGVVGDLLPLLSDLFALGADKMRADSRFAALEEGDVLDTWSPAFSFDVEPGYYQVTIDVSASSAGLSAGGGVFFSGILECVDLTFAASGE